VAQGSSSNGGVESTTAAAFIPESSNYYPTLGDARAALLSMQNKKQLQESSSLWTGSDSLDWSPGDVGKGRTRPLNGGVLDGSGGTQARHAPAFRGEVSF
jgi:hypothetical protein